MGKKKKNKTQEREEEKTTLKMDKHRTKTANNCDDLADFFYYFHFFVKPSSG